MIINKDYFKNLLDKTLKEYSERIHPIENVKLKFIHKDNFLVSAKEDELIKIQIQLGLYEDFEEEYPNFLIVYNHDKSPLCLLLTGSYYITICYEIAKEKLERFSETQVTNYLKYVFAHEITHILEEELKLKYKSLWQKDLTLTGYDESLAHELFAEDIAAIIAEEKDYEYILNELWAIINQRIKDLEQKRGF